MSLDPITDGAFGACGPPRGASDETLRALALQVRYAFEGIVECLLS